MVASSQDHARAIASQLAALTGEPPVLAISDDPEASRRLRDFAEVTTPWLVAVNMVSEGVDLPRLRVGVYATTVTTELYFRQVAGRLVRRRPTDPATLPAWLYLPSDPVLLRYARSVQTARRAALAASFDPPAQPAPVPASADRSPTAFQALGGVAWTQTVIAPVGMPSLPAGSPAAAPLPVYEVRDRLRVRHHRLVGAVARRWGLAHRVIHTELTHRTGTRLDAASLDQIQARLALLESWLAHGLPPA